MFLYSFQIAQGQANTIITSPRQNLSEIVVAGKRLLTK